MQSKSGYTYGHEDDLSSQIQSPCDPLPSFLTPTPVAATSRNTDELAIRLQG